MKNSFEYCKFSRRHFELPSLSGDTHDDDLFAPHLAHNKPARFGHKEHASRAGQARPSRAEPDKDVAGDHHADQTQVRLCRLCLRRSLSFIIISFNSVLVTQGLHQLMSLLLIRRRRRRRRLIDDKNNPNTMQSVGPRLPSPAHIKSI